MKQYIFNRKPSSKINNDIESSKATTLQPSIKNSEVWGMSSTDALKVNYIDEHPTHK